MGGERLLTCGDQVGLFGLSRFGLCFSFVPPPVGMAKSFVREPQSQGQAQPQTAFVPVSADGTALQLELPAAREIQTAAFAARRKLLPLQANLDTLVMFSSS